MDRGRLRRDNVKLVVVSEVSEWVECIQLFLDSELGHLNVVMRTEERGCSRSVKENGLGPKGKACRVRVRRLTPVLGVPQA